MRKYFTISFLLLLTICLPLSAQKMVKAADLMKDLKAGKDIAIKNATIEGHLDFTFMEEKLPDLPKRKRNWWGQSDNTVKNLIKSKVSFQNCTFKDDVLAYIPDGDNSGYTFIASFYNDAIFENCNFEGKAMFKYSKFEREASFKGAKFKEDTTFKYAEFDNNVSFSNAVFEESATFKYSKFKDGVSFRAVQFKEDLNIKYTKVIGDFDIKDMKVAYDVDSKYTKINGKSFSMYLLEKQ